MQIAEKAKQNREKIRQTMHEFKTGTLHSGSKKGPIVRNRRQAIAIALNQAAKALVESQATKAANYHARAGQTIAGNLTRGGNGQFASAGSGGAGSEDKPASKPAKPGKRNEQDRAERDQLYREQVAQRQQLVEQQRQAKLDEARSNVTDLAGQLLDSDTAEVLTTGDTPGDLSGVNAEYGDKLVARGLAVKYPDGSYDMSPTGKSMLNAMAKGDARRAKQAIMRAQALADRRAAAAARRSAPKKKRKEALGQRLLIAFKSYSRKQGAGGTVSHKETKPQGSFTVYKDSKGQWRWRSVSSSGFEDRDGEIVSTKALADDCDNCDSSGKYGALDWWHTPLVIGTCDFNAMHGALLLESGTFLNDRIALAFKAAIDSGDFEPGVSLTFEHNEPGPQVLPGRVFHSIRKIGRSLLPAEKASNLASAFDVINLPQQGLTNKEVARKMLEQKLRELETILGPDLTRQFLAGSEIAEKALQMAGVAYKAAAALDAPMSSDVAGAAQLPAKKPGGKVAEKDDPLLDAAMDNEDAAADDMDAAEDEEGLEDTPTDQEADAILQGLFATIGKMMTDKMSEFAGQIQTALSGLSSGSSEKEAALTTALKEVSTALTSLGTENRALKEKLTAMDNRLKGLEGEQPAIVQKRASQMPGLKADELPSHLQTLVSEKSQDVDPYVSMAANMFASPWLQPKA